MNLLSQKLVPKIKILILADLKFFNSNACIINANGKIFEILNSFKN